MDKPIFNKQPIIDALKKYYLRDELQYLSKVHNVNSFPPEMQASLKTDIKNRLEEVFADIEDDVTRIEEGIEWFRRDFENILEDTKAVFNQIDCGPECDREN